MEEAFANSVRRLEDPILDNELLRSFVAVVDRGSYTRAAQALNRTQSAVSLQVKRLEERLGVPLFEHPRRDITLTRQGEILLPHARQLIECNARVVVAIEEERLAGRVRIGCNNYHATAVLPRLLAEFARTHPDIRFVLQTGGQEMLSAGLGRDFDIILNFYVKGQHQGDIILEQQLFWVGSREYPVHTLKPLPVALSTEGTILRTLALDSLRRLERDFRLAYESPNIKATLAAAAEELAVSVTVDERLKEHPRLVRLGKNDGLEELPSCVFTIEAADRYLAPSTRLLWTFLRDRLVLHGA